MNKEDIIRYAIGEIIENGNLEIIGETFATD